MVRSIFNFFKNCCVFGLFYMLLCLNYVILATLYNQNS